ncbi:hypothetical protein SEA_HARLEQUIN_13 [Rhodococcus phage Harlequin]|nr:hypothetical protein SEA_HARLEQUIN_13 [Rhodococcus phage Harlequin]ASJ78816.1 hypothetical protein SEA_JESTER_13 [Rhodococcus phage Jester]
MPEIRNTANGGIASVSEELADKLKATGLWTDVAEVPKKTTRRAPAKKAAPAEPVAEPTEE